MAYVKSNGIRLSYTISGTGDPVLLVMGSGASAQVWDMYQTPALRAAGYRTVTFDNRGIAPSDVPPGRYALEDLVADTRGLVEALDLRGCHVVGLSLGGLIVQRLLATDPELFTSAVLVATRSRADRARLAQDAADVALRESGIQLPAGYRAVRTVFEMLSPATVNNDAAVAEWLDLFELTYEPGEPNGQVWIDTATDRTADLAAVTAPCRVIAFTDDVVSPPHLGAEVAAAIPGCDFVEIPDCGHLGHLERPEVFNEAMLDFLGKHAVGRAAVSRAGGVR
ncbi:alpha/beta fold hydrolase [Micromonospora robiginosa]|uniref:Alpha/beta fold hydrolase n=1 Tax=Micromonospora robiginosa TaxID=2749844 RepID=A0A7L6B3P6_9ACTN|nr:alpha/beta fold hydrolase [Micromonospora ferruginea]QLQ36504.1 alpha/beta fold hydrolase [Micromonospora ferruginea]